MENRFELHVTGPAMILGAFWLLALPLRWVGAIVLAAAVHELGHLTALWCCGIPVYQIRLDVGGAVICAGGMDEEEELICALSGPVAGAMLCLFGRWIPGAATCAFIHTVFNLIPVYPLDGGRVIRAVRNMCCKSREKRVQ